MYPEEIKSLCLIDASGLPSDKETPFIFRLAKNAFTAEILKVVLPKTVIEKNLEQVYHKDSLISASVVERYYELALREGNRDAFVARARTKNELNDQYQKLTSIKTPSLLIWGAHDTWIPVTQAYKFKELIPKSELVIIEGSGHIPMEEDPHESLKAYRNFLSDY